MRHHRSPPVLNPGFHPMSENVKNVGTVLRRVRYIGDLLGFVPVLSDLSSFIPESPE